MQFVPQGGGRTEIGVRENRSQPFRHELKYVISEGEREAMLRRLSPILKRDINGAAEGYTIRSLYFDDWWNTAYEEKTAGTFARKKYRIRIYDFSDKVIKLECKEKRGNYIQKTAVPVSKEEVNQILAGDYDFLLKREEGLCREFYIQCRTKGLRPKVMVDYERDAFVEQAGDVRITFDRNVRSGFMNFNLFDRALPVYEVLEAGKLILEVKYTQMLPEYVRRAATPENGIHVAASKYTLCVDKMREMVCL